MPVGGIQHHGVHAGGSQGLHAVQGVGRDAHAGSHAGAAIGLYPGHLGGLGLDSHVLMNDADAAREGHRQRHGGFRHRVHGGRCKGRIQIDVLGEPAPQGDFPGKDLGISGNQQDVVKGDSVRDYSVLEAHDSDSFT